ncbi:MAG TPA: class I SAM-dependent methyltransferase [Candidatus Melainabacteria bacterium]|nr:class I SAM-dependent methyltransferase [Candidatus Melainabacteria bacterium]
MDPALELEETYFARFQDEAKRSLVWKELSRYFQQWIDPHSAVLDLGAGYCEFINNIQAKQKYAMDLNPTTAAKARSDVTVISQDVTLKWPVESSSIDVVFSSNFLEHIPTKNGLMNCLREANRVLKSDGKLILLGPNIRFCSDVYWDFFDHHLPLSDRSAVEALGLAGFEAQKVIERFLPFTMQGGQPAHPILIRAYLMLPVAWLVLGKQFLIIARKARAPR